MRTGIVEVLVDVPVDKCFDYYSKYPLAVGQRVRVNFLGRRLTAVVSGFKEHSIMSVKQVLKKLDKDECHWYDDLDIKFLKQISDITWVGWGEMVFAGMPDFLRTSKSLDFCIDHRLRQNDEKTIKPSLLKGSLEFFWGDACAFHNFVVEKIHSLDANVFFWIVDSKSRAYSLAEQVSSRITLPVFVYHQGIGLERLKTIVEALNRGPCVIIGSRHLGFFPLIKNEVIFLEDAWMDIYRQEVTPKYDLNYVLRERLKFSNGKLFLNVIRPDKNRQLIMLQAREHKLLPVFVEEEFRKKVEEGKVCAIFIFGSGYAMSLRCNSCKSIQSCQRCERPYVLVKKNTENFLYCPSCGTEFLWKGNCLICSSLSVRLSTMGSEHWIRILKKRLWGLPVFIDSWNVVKPGIYIYQRWQRLCAGFDVGLLLGIDKVMAIDRFYARELALSFIAASLFKVKKLYVRTRFIELGDYKKLMMKELSLRKELNLPPYSKLLIINVRDKDPKKAQRLAENLKSQIKGILEDFRVNFSLLGIYAPEQKKKRDYYYYNIDLILPIDLNEEIGYNIKKLLLSFRKKSSSLVTVESYFFKEEDIKKIWLN